jgi:hypothetical protein
MLEMHATVAPTSDDSEVCSWSAAKDVGAGGWGDGVVRS